MVRPNFVGQSRLYYSFNPIPTSCPGSHRRPGGIWPPLNKIKISIETSHFVIPILKSYKIVSHGHFPQPSSFKNKKKLKQWLKMSLAKHYFYPILYLFCPISSIISNILRSLSFHMVPFQPFYAIKTVFHYICGGPPGGV